MGLTRTDDVFSRVAWMSDFCAGKVKIEVSRKIPRKFPKFFHSKRLQQSEDGPKGGHPWPRRPGGASTALAAPPGRLVKWDLPPGSPLALIFTRDEETLKQTLILQFSVAEPPPPLFFLRRANLGDVLASGEGRSSPSSSPSPLHHPSMCPPSMCE